ncbi:hypothetical protein QUB80_08035 [Chlorogloeopsis sp. ULAP01]|nr:hypothetical protein [Chlorogloeopsis sp. ULAP01]MDM9380654.1 hypothetical protein [Chlorogloeopsis sp. ULAP01]
MKQDSACQPGITASLSQREQTPDQHFIQDGCNSNKPRYVRLGCQ